MVRTVSSVQIGTIVLCLWVQCDDGFVVPAGGLTSVVKVGRNRALVSKVQSRLEREDIPWRQRISMSTAQPGDSISRRSGNWQRSGEREDEPKSRFGRIVQRVSHVMRRVVLGHVPARDEAPSRSRVTGIDGARRTDQSYARPDIPKGRSSSPLSCHDTLQPLTFLEESGDDGLLGLTPGAKLAWWLSIRRSARNLERMSHFSLRGYPSIMELPLEETSFLDGASLLQQMHGSNMQEDTTKRVVSATSGGGGVPSELKQHDGGALSPTESEEMMSSLRRRIEKGLRSDPDAEARETQRQLHAQQRRKQQQQGRERVGREASSPGDTAVAELPPPGKRSQGGVDTPRGDANGANARKRRSTPKLASREDVERMERLFGSTGGEPLP